jgi:nitrogen fixation NifU-like protein
MSQDLYQEIILEEFRNPQNFGKSEDADVVLHERNASCGDEITIYLKLDSSGKNVEKLMWEGQGCAISMAAASLVSAQLIGKSGDEIQQFKKENVEELLGLDEIAYGREKCLMLGLQAVQKAVVQGKK